MSIPQGDRYDPYSQESETLTGSRIYQNLQDLRMLNGLTRSAFRSKEETATLPTKLRSLNVTKSQKWGEQVLAACDSIGCSHFFDDGFAAVLRSTYDAQLKRASNRMWKDPLREVTSRTTHEDTCRDPREDATSIEPYPGSNATFRDPRDEHHRTTHGDT